MNRMDEPEEKNLGEDSRLTTEQERLVHNMANRLREYIPREMPWEDVLQYGFLGLAKAMRRYETGKGKFRCFAGLYIYGNIIDGIYQFRGVKRYRSANMLRLKPLKEEELYVLEKQLLWSAVEDIKTESELECVEDRVSLYKALQSLTPEERDLVEAHYFRQTAWEEYAREKFVDVEWVYLLHRRALKKLRKWLKG